MPKEPDYFTLIIELGNDAMRTPEDVAKLLSDTARYMRQTNEWPEKKLMDLNGNTIGSISVT